jgi:KDO2-lipid IV(A) lauroyltransferase
MLALFRFLSWFPLPLLHALGAFIGGLVWLLSSRERRRASENLALAFPDGAPAGVAWRSAQAAGRAIVELPWLWLRPIEQTTARVSRVEGWEAVEAARARGDALLFFTPHIGCFEMAGQFIGARLPITVLYRPPKNPALQPLYDAGRNRGHMRGAAADSAGVRAMLKALRQKEAVGILPDQVPQHGEGIWAPFFGRPAYTMTLAARFSTMKGISTFFVYATREAGGRYHFIVHPETLPPVEGDEVTRVTAINRVVEDIIRQRPDQYIWSYNRYKAPHAEAHAKLESAAAQRPDGKA